MLSKKITSSKNNPTNVGKKKTLIDVNQKVVSIDDGLKHHQLTLSKITLDEIDKK